MRDRKLDPIDHKLLELLQKDARMRLNKIAEMLGLTIPAISHRVQKPEEAGFIKGYTAILDAKRIGKDITAFITVTADSSKHYQMFVDRIKETEEILECHSVIGESSSHLLKVRTENVNLLEGLVARIQSWPGVLSTKTNFVLSTIKESTVLKTQKKPL
jgi:Lrp/AsnC family leucine-responsive transcriptional regulator